MKIRKALFGNAAVYLAATIANAAIPLLLLPVLTRVLTPADYGVVTMFGLMLSVFGAFTGLNVHGAVNVRYFQMPKHELAQYVAACIGVLGASTAVVALVIVLFGPALQAVTDVPADWLLVGVAVSGLQFLINIRLALWQASSQARRYGGFLIMQSSANALVSLGLVLGVGLTWKGRVLGQVSAVALFGFLASWGLASDGYLRRPRQWKPLVSDALRFGVPLVPHAIGGLLIVAADRLVIVNTLGIADAGVYMVALQVGQAVGLLTDAFNKAYAPWLMKTLSGSRSELRVNIVRGTYLYFFVVVAIALAYGAAAPALFGLLVGPSFHAAADLVTYIALGLAFGGCYYMVTNYIFFESRTGMLAGVTFASGVLNLALTFALVQRCGVKGAALAFMITNAVTFLGTWWVAHAVHPMPWLKALKTSEP